MLGSGVYPAAGGLNEDHGIAIDPSSARTTSSPPIRSTSAWSGSTSNGSNPFDWGVKGVVESTASFNWAQGVAYDPANGNVWVANTRNNRIDEFTTAGVKVTSCPNTTRLTSSFNWPMAIAFDPRRRCTSPTPSTTASQAINVSQCTGQHRHAASGASARADRAPISSSSRGISSSTPPATGCSWSTRTTTGSCRSTRPPAPGTASSQGSPRAAASEQVSQPEGITVDAPATSGSPTPATTGSRSLLVAGGSPLQMFGTYGCSQRTNNAQRAAGPRIRQRRAALRGGCQQQPHPGAAAGRVIRSSTLAHRHTSATSSMPAASRRCIPRAVDADSAGTMWLADSGGSRIDKITSGGTLSYVTPTSGTRAQQPEKPVARRRDADDLWITDTGNNGIVEMTTREPC